MPETHQTFVTVLEATGGNNVGIVVPDEVEVRLVVDDSPRTVEVPAELSSALDSTPGASAAWEALSPSKQKAHVLSSPRPRPRRRASDASRR